MKKLLILFILICAGVLSYFLVIKPYMEQNTKFISSDTPARTVVIPLGGKEYVDIKVDGINNELLETNQSTFWKFNDAKVVRTSVVTEGRAYNGAYYKTNKEVYNKFGNYYVTVLSDSQHVKDSFTSLCEHEPYIAKCPELKEELRIGILSVVDVPYIEVDGWKLPNGLEELTLSQSKDDMSYYKGNTYFNYNFRYQKHGDAVEDAATRVCTLSGKALEWWYDDGNIAVFKAGDEVACVKQRDYTSCYFVSSNLLDYVVLNCN